MEREIAVKDCLMQDRHIRELLEIVRSLHLKDSWLCAGVVRNFIWNILSCKEEFDDQTDVDVVFYDASLSYEETVQMEEKVKKNYPKYRWEVRNQAYMHHHSPGTRPYTDARDAISKYPERCTAVAIRLQENGELELFCPYGLQEIMDFRVRPTEHFLESTERMKVYHERLGKKNWAEKWPNLVFEES